MPRAHLHLRHTRAIRAALAVSLGGAAACGSEPTDDPDDATFDAVADTTSDVDNDAPDASADTGTCSIIHDQTCPDACTELTDADCCDTFCGGAGWGYLNNGECNCAVEGPFAPPSFSRRRASARAELA